MFDLRRYLTSAILISFFFSISAPPAWSASAKSAAPAPSAPPPVRIAPNPILPAAGATLTLQEVLRYTYAHNSTIRAQRAELNATHELLPQAQAGWKPVISASANATHADTDISGGAGSSFFVRNGVNTSKAFDVTLDQPLYRGGRTKANIDAASYAIAARTRLLEATEQAILFDAATAYMNVLRDQALLDLALNNQDVISKDLQVTQSRFDVGELTKTDVSQANARLARAQSEITRARGNLNTSKSQFIRVTGMEPLLLAQPPDVFGGALPPSAQDAAARAENRSPLVLAAVNAHKAAERDVDSQFGQLLPDVGFVASWNKTYDPGTSGIDDETSKIVGLRASMPLYEAGAVRSRVRQSKEVTNQRYLEVLDTKLAVHQETVAAWEDLQAADSEIQSRTAEAEAARLAREGVRQEADIGTRTTLDALDADQELLNAQSALVTARRDKTVAQFALLSRMGDLTPETLGFANETITADRHLKDIQRKIFDMDVDRAGPSP